MKITALIPARAGSKRIPNKNIKILNGHPLFAYSILTAQHCESINEIIFSTDSEKYAEMAKKYNVSILMRPPELASDMATDYDVIKHAMNEFYCGDMIIYLRPTTPIRAAGTMERAIHTIKVAYHNISGLRSVEEMSESAYKNFSIAFGFLKALFGSIHDTNLPNQLLTKTYKANGYVDIILPKQGKIPINVYGDKCVAFITPRTIEIDTIDDFKYAEWQMKMRGFREEVRFV